MSKKTEDKNIIKEKSAKSMLKAKEKKNADKDITIEESVDWAKFNIFPIFIFLFFIAMAVFFTIPQVQVLFDGLDEIDRLQSEVDSKDQTIERLDALRQSQTADAQLLEVMNDVVPSESTRVINYKDLLVEIGQGAGLSVSESRAGENIRLNENLDVLDEGIPNDELHIIIIPIDVKAEGSISEFETFLFNLYTSYDFFVVEEMEISLASIREGAETVDQWVATFRIVKYQFGGSVNLTDVDIESYVDLANQKPDQMVVDFIQEKFSIRQNLIQEQAGLTQ